jgi:hypothetical protein
MMYVRAGPFSGMGSSHTGDQRHLRPPSSNVQGIDHRSRFRDEALATAVSDSVVQRRFSCSPRAFALSRSSRRCRALRRRRLTSVSARRIGLRMAIGAQRGDVLAWSSAA